MNGVVARAFAALLILLSLVATEPARKVQAAAAAYQPELGQHGKDVIWLPTPDALVTRMLDLAQVQANDVLIDLGSGDGRTVIAAARRGARSHGIEFNEEMVEYARQAAKRAGVAERATFERADLFYADLSGATVITMFLLDEINLKLRPRLLELRPGTRIVSNTFEMGDWLPDATAAVSEREGCEGYCNALLWIVPARIAGTWQEGDLRLRVTQSFQSFSGSVERGGRRAPIVNGHIRGADISFESDGDRYQGRVEGAAMSGTITRRDGSKAPWNARRGTPKA